MHEIIKSVHSLAEALELLVVTERGQLDTKSEAGAKGIALFLEMLSEVCSRCLIVMALWETFYIENKRSDLDTLRVPNRSPTPITKSNDFLGQSDDIWGARGPPFPADLGGSRGPGRL